MTSITNPAHHHVKAIILMSRRSYEEKMCKVLTSKGNEVIETLTIEEKLEALLRKQQSTR